MRRLGGPLGIFFGERAGGQGEQMDRSEINDTGNGKQSIKVLTVGLDGH